MIGADTQLSNKDLFVIMLELMGKPSDWYEYVPDRPGHDLRYAIDATKIRSQLNWQPNYTDFRDGLKQTIHWYEKNCDWWEPLKVATEARYQELGR